MKKKIIYTDAPPEIEEAIERSVRVKDTLPPPSVLRNAKKTITTKNGITTMRFTSPEVEEAIVTKFPRKSSAFLSGKVAVL